MSSKRLLGCLLGGLLAFSALASAQPQNPTTVKVDGVALDGVIGYRVEFNRQPTVTTDSRRLDLSYSPNQRTLFLSVTQSGLKGLQDWLNQATSGGTPTAKAVTLTSKNLTGDVLVSWQLTGVVPTTLSQASASVGSDISATLEFVFEQMQLVDPGGK
jgi:hypothetical protein